MPVKRKKRKFLNFISSKNPKKKDNSGLKRKFNMNNSGDNIAALWSGDECTLALPANTTRLATAAQVLERSRHPYYGAVKNRDRADWKGSASGSLESGIELLTAATAADTSRCGGGGGIAAAPLPPLPPLPLLPPPRPVVNMLPTVALYSSLQKLLFERERV